MNNEYIDISCCDPNIPLFFLFLKCLLIVYYDDNGNYFQTALNILILLMRDKLHVIS